jgi:hypothetical protein
MRSASVAMALMRSRKAGEVCYVAPRSEDIDLK